jgi:hypothetical protein
MITTASVKNTNGKKSPSKVEGGILKRLPIKRIYCTRCKKLVKGQVQNSADTKRIVCPGCGLHLWVWKNTGWAAAKRDANV